MNAESLTEMMEEVEGKGDKYDVKKDERLDGHKV
jgi:hypothetical protein